MSSAAIADDHALLLVAVREAGAIALAAFAAGSPSWDKAPGHPVCEADLAVNEALRDRLMGARPDYGWLSEESADTGARLAAARVWVVDPIDGTRAFLAGRPEFAISVALVVGARPVAGVVYNPATGELFEARAGAGAHCNGTPLRVAADRDLATARIAISRSERRRAEWLGTLATTPISSIAYKLALVAQGRFDAMVTLWPKTEWDLCAGDLLVGEAGGRVTDAGGAPLRYNRPDPRVPSLVAGAPAVHAALLAHLAATA